jgi:hypothetical protein
MQALWLPQPEASWGRGWPPDWGCHKKQIKIIKLNFYIIIKLELILLVIYLLNNLTSLTN